MKHRLRRSAFLKFSLIHLVCLAVAGLVRAGDAATVDVFNVRNFGAVGDGRISTARPLTRRSPPPPHAGGGTVLVPAGTYLSGSIHLQSNIHLLIDAGATILGAPQNLNAYDETEPFPGNRLSGRRPLLFSQQPDLGRKSHECFHHRPWHDQWRRPGARIDGILDEMCGYRPFQPTPNTKTYPPVRIGNKAIALKLCKNVLIRDITIFHGGHFAILVTGCDNLTVDNVTMDTDRDGIDIDCCRNTMVSNCRINSPTDDGLCPKSTYALGEIRLTENLTIVNCQVSGFVEGTLLDGTMKPARNGYGRIKFGTESSGGFRNCTVANCTFRSCHGLALEEVDGGILENITINNLSMMDVRDCAIYITTGKRNRAPGRHHQQPRAEHFNLQRHRRRRGQNERHPNHAACPNSRWKACAWKTSASPARAAARRRTPPASPRNWATAIPNPSKLGTLPAYGIFARHVQGSGTGEHPV